MKVRKQSLGSILFAMLLAALSGFPILAQAEPVAKKVYEYGGDPRYEEESAYLEYAFRELSKASKSKLYIVGYGSPGTTRRRVMRALAYAEARGFDIGRVIPVIGGNRPDPWIDLWIVPDGVAAPVLSATPPPELSKKALASKFDEFYLSGEWFNFQKEPVLLDGFAETLKIQPDSIGYIIVYKGRGFACEYCYFWGKELAFANDLRQYLSKTHRIIPQRIKIIDRGYRSGKMELWVVPHGMRLPPPSTR